MISSGLAYLFCVNRHEGLITMTIKVGLKILRLLEVTLVYTTNVPR